MGYDGLLLDHDGVLVTLGDRESLTAAATAALRDAGVREPDPATVETLRVSVDREELDAISGRHDLDPETLWAHRDDRVAEALRTEATSGRKAPYDDVTTLEDIDHPLGIVSNNQTRVVEFVLDHYGLADRFDAVHARSPTPASLARKKPAPTYLEAAMADLDVAEPLYVGDSESDVVAGHRAGLDVAFLRRDHNADATLDAIPRYEVESLAALDPILDGGGP